MISPLFKRIWEPEERERLTPLRVTQTTEEVAQPFSGTPEVRKRIGLAPIEPRWAVAVDGIEGAEEELLSLATGYPLHGGEHPLAIHVNRASSLIAARTRRGAGNTILIHPDGVARFDEGLSFSPITPRIRLVFGEGIGTPDRWFHAGEFNQTMNIYTCTDLPRDRLFVAYLGNTALDQPGYLARDDGKFELILLERNEEFLGSTHDFIMSVEY